MNNTINSNVNFKAEFVNRTTVKNPKRLKKIREVFKHETEEFKGKLYASTFNPLEEEQTFMTLHLSTVKNKAMNAEIPGANYHEGEELITKSLDDYMETMTDKQIGQKLARVFKVLYYQNVKQTKMPEFRTFIDIAAIHLEDLKKENADLYADALNVFGTQLEKLNKKYIQKNEKLNKNIRQLVKNDKELSDHVGVVL